MNYFQFLYKSLSFFFLQKNSLVMFTFCYLLTLGLENCLFLQSLWLSKKSFKYPDYFYQLFIIRLISLVLESLKKILFAFYYIDFRHEIYIRSFNQVFNPNLHNLSDLKKEDGVIQLRIQRGCDSFCKLVGLLITDLIPNLVQLFLLLYAYRNNLLMFICSVLVSSLSVLLTISISIYKRSLECRKNVESTEINRIGNLDLSVNIDNLLYYHLKLGGLELLGDLFCKFLFDILEISMYSTNSTKFYICLSILKKHYSTLKLLNNFISNTFKLSAEAELIYDFINDQFE